MRVICGVLDWKNKSDFTQLCISCIVHDLRRSTGIEYDDHYSDVIVHCHTKFA